MTETIIRFATIEDLNTLIEFNYKLAAETENKLLNRDVLTNGVLNLLKDKNKGFYLVTEINKKVIAQTMITYEWSDWRNGNFWWIQSVYVLPEFRKHGIFKLLFEYIKNMAINEDNVCGLRLYVDKENEIAINVYKKLNMKQSNYLFYELEFK